MSKTRIMFPLLLIGFLWLSTPALSIDVLFIGSQTISTNLFDKTQQACQFYGLELLIHQFPGHSSLQDLNFLLQTSSPSAIIIAASSLIDYDVRELLSHLRESADYNPSILIADLDPSIDKEIINEISLETIIECENLDTLPLSAQYRVVGESGITHSLFMQEYDINIIQASAFRFNATREISPVICLSLDLRSFCAPVFAKITDGTSETFFLAKYHASGSPYLLHPEIDRGSLLELVPILIFLRHACQNRCWHAPGYFANLIIDDPWLRERYGYIQYNSLLYEMQKANFHTTLAFVPWNYDRNNADVVSLFQAHSDRFSICIHGNNHNRRAFSGNTSIIEQEYDILQGLARMDAFHRLTGIPYDRVMVFPHSIAPQKTLPILKKHNFLCTINADNIPAGASSPKDILFYLRNSTLEYENFLSVRRVGAYTMKESDFALDLFFGNPILLYSHHTLFRDGLDKFNAQADIINKLEPSIRWANLGTISRNLFLMRQNSVEGYDVLAMSRTIEVSNPNEFPSTVHFHKPETGADQIQELTINQITYPYEIRANSIYTTFVIPPLQKYVVNICYKNNADLGAVELSKNNVQINLLRNISDFRDNTLSILPFGYFIIDLYYNPHAFPGGKAGLFFFVLTILCIVAFVFYYAVHRFRKARLDRENVNKSGTLSS